jgi:hypothetical protein
MVARSAQMSEVAGDVNGVYRRLGSQLQSSDAHEAAVAAATIAILASHSEADATLVVSQVHVCVRE